TSINATCVNESFFKSLNIIRKPNSTSDIITHSAINQPHENVIAMYNFGSEITQTRAQAKAIFKGVSLMQHYRFLNIAGLPLAPTFPPPGFFLREFSFNVCFFSWKAPLKSGSSFRF